MLKQTVGGVLLTIMISGAGAHDALLAEALARAAVPINALHGNIQTHSFVKGGSDPDEESETIDVQKSPKQAMPSYAGLQKVIGADAHVISQDGGRTIYAFTTETILARSADSNHVQLELNKANPVEAFKGKAEVSLDSQGHPFVSRVDLQLAKTAGNLIARIRQFDLSYLFLPAATTGAMITTAFTADVDVRALLFVHRKAHYEERFAMIEPHP